MKRGPRIASLVLASLMVGGGLATAGSAARAEDPAPEPSRIVLTPTETPNTSQSFTWFAATSADSTGTLQIRPTAGGLTRTVEGSGRGASPADDRRHFSATVTGLEAATSYEYRVASGISWSGWKTFSTADPSDKNFDYIYFGDAQMGLDTTWPRIVAQALERAPDAIGTVHAGDLVNAGSDDAQWRSWFAGMETSAATKNVFAAPGNHEYLGDRLLTSWKSHFEYPLNQPRDSTIGDMATLATGSTAVARQYRAYFDHWSALAAETVYFSDYQGVRFITVNATRDTTFLTPPVLPACSGADCPSTKVSALWTQYQAQWLDHVLGNSPSKWNVVTFHQPVYSASTGRDEPILRQYWVPVLEKHDVDLVQMGHDHVYARGYNNQDRTSTPGITEGPVYVVSNSGAKHYDLDTAATNVWTNNGATQVRKGGDFSTYQVISVSADALHYRSYVAEKTATATTNQAVGDLWDEFTVSKSDAGRKFVTEAGVPVPPLDEPLPPVKKATKVSIGGTSFELGAKGAVRVTPSKAGRVKVAVRQGSVTRVSYGSATRGGSAIRVTTRALSRSGTRSLKVSVRLLPTNSTTYAESTASKAATARR